MWMLVEALLSSSVAPDCIRSCIRVFTSDGNEDCREFKEEMMVVKGKGEI
jgi:hypothetical protein